MTNILNDQFAFWVFLVPGFVLIWSFRYFTNSDKKGDFEFFGLSIAGGFFIFLLYGILVKLGAFKIPEGETYIYFLAIPLFVISFMTGLICAQISKYNWFKSIIKFLRSKWFN